MLIRPPQSQTLTATELLALFTERLEAVGGHVDLANDPTGIAAHIQRLAGELDLTPDTTIWTSRELRDTVPDLVRALGDTGLSTSVADGPADVRDQPLGIAIAHAAIAETGSVLLVEPNVPDRSVTLMTQALVVVCPLSGLIPSLDEAATILREISGDGASYATFVTGPSRTADIERELTVGVQGPGRLDVILVGEAGGSAAQPSPPA